MHTPAIVRATLLHNPNAGSRDGGHEDDLAEELRALGWKVRVLHRDALDEAMEDPGDVIVVAGGDGTVARVAKRLANTGIPLAPIPRGTANNIARSVGAGLDPHIAVRGLAHAKTRKIDVGVAREGGAEAEAFVEGIGFGLMAFAIGARAKKKHKPLPKGRELLAEVIEEYAPIRYEIELDGVDLSGEYLLVSAMNLPTVGPAVPLAPEAKIDDGQLDLVLVRPESRELVEAHLRRGAKEGDLVLPALETHRGKHVRIKSEGNWVHLDDQAREVKGVFEIDVLAQAVHVVLPGP